MPDNFSLWQEHEREKERWLAKCPVCTYCREPIQDERAWRILDEFYHTKCADEEFGIWTEDYMA